MTEPKITPEQIAVAIEAGNAIICYEKCWSCQFGEHYGDPTWHTRADDEDVQHAAKTGQPDPRSSRCGCSCADAPRGDS